MAFEVLGNKVCLLGAVVGLKTLLTKSTVMTLQETLGIPLLLCRLLGFKRESLCYLRGRLSTFLGYVQSGYKQLDLSLRSKILFLTLKNHSSWMGKYTSGAVFLLQCLQMSMLLYTNLQVAPGSTHIKIWFHAGAGQGLPLL